jgi:hypothetical protein
MYSTQLTHSFRDDHLDALLKFVFQEKYVPVLRYFPTTGTVTNDEISSDSFLKFYKNITDTVLFLDMDRVDKDSKVCGRITSSNRVKAWIGSSIPSPKDNLQFITTRFRKKEGRSITGTAIFKLPKEIFVQYGHGSKFAYISVTSESSYVAKSWIENPQQEQSSTNEQPNTIRVEITTEAQTIQSDKN